MRMLLAGEATRDIGAVRETQGLCRCSPKSLGQKNTLGVAPNGAHAAPTFLVLRTTRHTWDFRGCTTANTHSDCGLPGRTVCDFH